MTTEMLASPDQTHDARRAAAHLHFSHIQNKTVLTTSRAASPLRILSPQNPGTAAWVYTSSFGGGLLAGDDLSLHITADPHTTAYLSTQSSTKVYRSDNGMVSRQSLHAKIAAHALFILLPDPVSCFAGSRYHQHQSFDLAPTASLILFDGFTSGRHAAGERWAATDYFSKNEIWIDGKCLLRDRLHLTPNASPSTRLGMNRFNCIATLLLIGPRLQTHADALLQHIQQSPVSPSIPIPLSASPLASPASPDTKGLILRAAGPTAESITQTLFPLLNFLSNHLNQTPWSRKW